jgi:hypothetical protein
MPQRVLGEGLMYPMAGEKAAALRNVFPDNPMRFCLAMRNPATFIPALFNAAGETNFLNFIAGVDVTSLRWSETLGRMCRAAPDCPITVWCNEDTPLTWLSVLAAVSGQKPGTQLAGTDDFIATLMSSEGMSRLQGYMSEHPPANEERRRHVLSAFLEKFGLTDELEVELDLPGWTADLIAEMTASYDADMAAVATIPGVTLVQ